LKTIPTYSGTLRSHLLTIPSVISQCSGIRVFGRRIKSLVFTTDVAIIKNVNADAIIAVYPFTPQPAITQAIINVSDVPVFVGVGGGMTNGDRSVRLAQDAENQGAYGVVVNAPITTETISKMKALVDIPVITTIVSSGMDVAARVKAGADILNVSGASRTPEIVAQLRREFPDMAIIATGGPTEEDIIRTIEAGANAITYTPPTTGELFVPIMREHRKNFAAEKL
jgi:2-keto-3-deoxy-6-phosphogluconate aldolase